MLNPGEIFATKMANIGEESLFYLTTINSLAEKISRDLTLLERINDSDEIDGDSCDTESPLLNGENDTEADSDICVFPKYMVNCGEKNVIDFEHEGGWTWRDEHSGPFSWMTRSQQELNILGLCCILTLILHRFRNNIFL